MTNERRSLTLLVLNKSSWKRDEPGGAEINLEESLTRLADRGHTIHLLTGPEDGCPSFEQDNGIKIRRVGMGNSLSNLYDLLLTYLFVSAYFYIYSFRLEPDVVYTVNTPLPWPILTLRSRVAIYHHLALDTIFDTHSFPQNILSYIAQSVGVFRDRKIPTISVSSSTTQALVSHGHDQESVYEIHNGIDIKEYSPGDEAETTRILYVGGLNRTKGVDRLANIHQAVQMKYSSEVRLDVVGRDGELRTDIQNYCTNTEHAHFHGYVSKEKKIHLLQRAWVLVVPSRVEGWGIVVLEANACGTPVVASNVSGLRDSVKHGKTGLLSDCEHPIEFGSDVVQILEDENLREELSKGGVKWARQHSWDNTAEDLETVFQSTVE